MGLWSGGWGSRHEPEAGGPAPGHLVQRGGPGLRDGAAGPRPGGLRGGGCWDGGGMLRGDGGGGREVRWGATGGPEAGEMWLEYDVDRR